MVIVNTDPREDRSSTQQEQPNDTESEQIEKTLFGFQDLASDYYQVIFLEGLRNLARIFRLRK